MTVTTDKEHDTDEKPNATEAPADTEADAVEGSGADPASPESDVRPERRWRRRTLVGGAVVLLVSAIAGAGFLGWHVWQERQVARAGEEARQAAAEYAQVLTSIDSQKVDENFDAVLDGATGEFKDMYSQSSTELRQLLIDNKASAHGVVVESAIQSETRTRVVVLLFVDQSVSNANVPDPRIDRSRIKMTMEHVDGRWRASKVELP